MDKPGAPSPDGRCQRGALQQSKRFTTTLLIIWSILILANFSGRALCSGTQIMATDINTSVSYGNNRARQMPRDQPLPSSYQQPAAKFEHQIGLIPSSSDKRQQPSVYHSIIDVANTHLSPISSAIQTSSSSQGDLNTAAGHHHGHHDHGKYYEYRSVPKKKTWKFGYKRGNHKHTISRHEHGKAGKHPHFKTKVKWHDSKSKGKGIHLWDYNHHDKKHYKYHG